MAATVTLIAGDDVGSTYDLLAGQHLRRDRVRQHDATVTVNGFPAPWSSASAGDVCAAPDGSLRLDAANTVTRDPGHVPTAAHRDRLRARRLPAPRPARRGRRRRVGDAVLDAVRRRDQLPGSPSTTLSSTQLAGLETTTTSIDLTVPQQPGPMELNVSALADEDDRHLVSAPVTDTANLTIVQ